MTDEGLARLLQRKYWHLLVHRSQIAHQNDFVRFDWFDEEIVVFNDHGEILVFDNVCPHRGARIFVDNEGNQRLRCGYHGWSYQQGRFFAPFPQQIDEAELARARYRTLRYEWCGDFLFAAIDPLNSLTDQLGGMWKLLADVSASIAKPYSTNVFIWESDWRIALENALEQYHTAVGLVHPGSFGKHATTAGHDEFFATNSAYRCEYANPRTVGQLRKLSRFFDVQFQWEGYQSIYLFPFSMIGSTFGYSYALQNFFPSSIKNQTYFSSRMLTSKLAAGIKPQILDSFFASSAEINRKIFEEDHAICQRVSPRSLDNDFVPILAASEVKIAHFRDWLKRAAQ